MMNSALSLIIFPVTSLREEHDEEFRLSPITTVLIVEEKVDPKTAQGILRHTDAGLTMNIRTHAQDPAKRRGAVNTGDYAP